jgi:hypothetical protein
MSLWGPFANFSLPLCILHRKYYHVSAFHSHSEKFGIGDHSTHFGIHLVEFGLIPLSSQGRLDQCLPNLSVVFEYQFLLIINQVLLIISQFLLRISQFLLRIFQFLLRIYQCMLKHSFSEIPTRFLTPYR